MKEKILQALKTKFKNLGFGDTTFDAVASFLEATVTEENQIDTSVSGVESLLKGFQADADKRVTTAVQKVKTETQKGGEDKKQEPTNTPSEEIPSWFKTFSETITSKINAIETGKVIETRKSVLESKLTNCSAELKVKILKDFSRMNFETQEDFDLYLAETEQDVATIAQQSSNESLSAVPKPFMGKVTKDGISTSTAEYIESMSEGSKPSMQGKPLFD